MPLTTVYTSSQAGTNTDSGFSYRLRCALTGGGQKVQVSIKTVNAGGTLICDHAAVGIWSGTNWDTVSTPVELTFNSGGHGFSVAGNGATLVSDEIDLGTAFTSSDKLVVVLDWAAGNTGQWASGAASNCDIGYFSANASTYNVASAGAPAGSTLATADGGLILIQAEAGTTPGPTGSLPRRNVLLPSRGPTRGLQAVRAFPGGIIASGTWSSTGAANDAIWAGQSVGPPLALPITQRILRPNIGPSRGLQQVKGFPPAAGTTISATWSSTGTANDAIWTGAAIDAATWSSVGSGTANWTGAATGAATWSSAGAANDAIWVGTGVLGGVWSATGIGAATWVGLGVSIQSGVWASAGSGAAIWTGASVFSGVWAASGIGVATWTGAATAAATWNATGLGAAQWVGSTSASIVSGVWSSTGIGAATWTGTGLTGGVWGASGLSNVSWAGASNQGVLSANGFGTALWIGADATPSAVPFLRWNLERVGKTRKRKPTLLEILADIIEEDPPPKVTSHRRQKVRAAAALDRWAEEIIDRAQREAGSYELNYARPTIAKALREHAATLIDAAIERRLDQEEEEAILLLLSHYH